MDMEQESIKKEKIKQHLGMRYSSVPGMPVPPELIDSALSYIPERLAGKFSVLYVQSPADWDRVSGEIGTAVEEWNAGHTHEATLRFIKVVLDTCI